MPQTFEIPEQAKPFVTIGFDAAAKNKIRCTVKVPGEGRFYLTIQIPIGGSGVFKEGKDVGARKPGIIITPFPGRQNGELSFNKRSAELAQWTDGDGIVNPPGGPKDYVLELSPILCNAGTGDTSIQIIASDVEGKGTTLVQPIGKQEPSDGNPILYFYAEPPYLSSAGQKVKLNWRSTGKAGLLLHTSAAPEGIDVNDGEGEKLEVLHEDHTYTLRVKGNSVYQRQVIVPVVRSGWHVIHDPSELEIFPSVLFCTDPAKNEEFPADDTDCLYAIFSARGGNAPALLRSSANGMTGWENITGIVPPCMESSPGLRVGSRLWLIGGSTADPDKRSNGFFYKDLDKNTGWELAHVEGGEDFVARMGHACVRIDNNTIWVLGGFRPEGCLNDVWRFEIQKDAKVHATKVEHRGERWDPRCMFSAVKLADGSLWICGGMTRPNGEPLSDIFRRDPKTGEWKQRPKNESHTHHIDNAIGIAAVASHKSDRKMVVVFTKRSGTGERVFELLMRELLTSNDLHDSWQPVAAPKPESNPPLMRTRPHSITATWFKGKLFVRYLHRNSMHGEYGAAWQPILNFKVPG